MTESQKEILARHNEQIDQLETRVQERREAEKALFDKLDAMTNCMGEMKTTISQNITDLRVEFVSWRSRTQVVGALALVLIPAIVTIVLEKII